MEFPIRVYTNSYLLSGLCESNDAFLGWLNSQDRQTIEMKQVEGLSLDPQALLVSFQQPMVVLPKSQIVAVEMLYAQTGELISLPPRQDLVVLYTRRFVFRAYAHPSGEASVTNLLNVVSGNFFPISHVQFHSVIPTRELPVDYARLMIVNRSCIDLFHPQE
jgi:hypothetical protein